LPLHCWKPRDGVAATTDLFVGSVDNDGEERRRRRGGKVGPYRELRGTSRSAKLTLNARYTHYHSVSTEGVRAIFGQRDPPSELWNSGLKRFYLNSRIQ
jgi:hypothetical protein